jgi:hypothetical protein
LQRFIRIAKRNRKILFFSLHIQRRDFRNKGGSMTKKEENKLAALLKKLYGKNWQFTWKSADSGFSLKLEVEKTAKETV